MLLWHASLWWHRIGTALLLRDVVLICQSLLLLQGHIAWVHLSILRDARAALLRGQVLRGRFFGGFDSILVINAILIATSRFRGIQASLDYCKQSFK
jgi:hypothetical protein